jgi:NADPH:quinone reductase-like Zn-dependent oxidoreductase
MFAAILHERDAPPVYEAFPEPALESGERAVRVLAAGLHPVVRALARGTHYGSANHLPEILGVDGIGQLDDGARVYFGRGRPPYGTFAERAVTLLCLPIPDGLDTIQAAGLINPGMSAWLALRWRAQLEPGQTVLINGATGAAGQLAVQIAQTLDAGRIIATGRNRRVLERLAADTLVDLQQAPDAIADAVRGQRIDAIIDYLWGPPTEAILQGIFTPGLRHEAPQVRLVQVGDSAGATISLPAAVLRSSNLEVSGSGAGSVSMARIADELPHFLDFAVREHLCLDVEAVPLREVASVWQQPSTDGRRVVFVP